MDGPTGVGRGPERYGASVDDARRDELKRLLARFEAAVDVSDPEQVAALEDMRRETRELEQLRGVWHARGLPGVQRDWNALTEGDTSKPPLEDPALRAYREHRREREEGGEFERQPPRMLHAPVPKH